MERFEYTDMDSDTLWISSVLNGLVVTTWFNHRAQHIEVYLPVETTDALIAWLQECRKQTTGTTAIGCPNGIEGVVPPEDEKEVE